MIPIKNDGFYLFENYNEAFEYYKKLSHVLFDDKEQKNEYIKNSLCYISKMVRPLFRNRKQTEKEKREVYIELKECLLWMV